MNGKVAAVGGGVEGIEERQGEEDDGDVVSVVAFFVLPSPCRLDQQLLGGEVSVELLLGLSLGGGCDDLNGFLGAHHAPDPVGASQEELVAFRDLMLTQLRLRRHTLVWHEKR